MIGPRQKIFVSAMKGDLEKQRRQATCEHDWRPVHGIVLDYIEVNSRCAKCDTFMG